MGEFNSQPGPWRRSGDGYRSPGPERIPRWRCGRNRDVRTWSFAVARAGCAQTDMVSGNERGAPAQGVAGRWAKIVWQVRAAKYVIRRNAARSSTGALNQP